MQPVALQFCESPRSPLRRARTRISLSPVDQPAIISRKCEFVGSLSAVNAHMSAEGLLRQAPIQPLVSEIALKPTTPNAVRKLKRDEKKSQHEKEQETALIELATYPGYLPYRVTPLPHQLNTLQHMQMVTQAQNYLHTKHAFKQYWEELFYSETSQNIFLDVFWWYFLHRYQSNQKIQNLLFRRIAENYVSLLTKATKRYRDVFFKIYPNVLAQCVYSAYIHAFPTSWNSFDDDFKTGLCDFISMWFKGMRSLPEDWKIWNIYALEPKNLMKNISGKETQSPCKRFDLDKLLSDAQPHANVSSFGLAQSKTDESGFVEEKVKRNIEVTRKHSKPVVKPLYTRSRSIERHQTIAGPDFEHAVLDIHSHSPLVRYFLSKQSLLYHTGYACLIQHTGIKKQPSQTGDTYSQVLRQSMKKSNDTQQRFQKYYTSIKQHMNKHDQERKLAKNQHEQDIHRLLSHPREVRTLGNYFTVNLLTDQSDTVYTDAEQPEKQRKEKAQHAITDSIKRLS